MGKENTGKVIIYFSLLFIFVIGSLVAAIFIIPNYIKEYTRIASLLIWVGLFFVSILIPNEHTKFKGQSEKIKTTIIILIIYYIIYFLSGIMVGYTTNPYSRAITKIIENSIFIVGLAGIQEYIRAKLVNYKKKKAVYIIVTVIFVIVNINISTLISLILNAELSFEYICQTLLTGIAISGLSTYLAIAGGYKLVYAYIIPIKILEIVVPIFPNLDWFTFSVFQLVLIITLIFYNNYEHTIKTIRMTRREIRRESPRKLLPLIIILVIGVSFVSGMFPLSPVAIMSNSMVPIFSRGSVVITKRIEKNYESIKIGDIIEFATNNGKVVHRVVQIEKKQNGEYMFITKGDMNSTNDPTPVSQENILGIVQFSIPYIGYPSVWFSEMFLGKKSTIQL